MKADRFFARHPVFTRAEFAASCGDASTGKGRAPDSLLAYHVRAGRLLRVKQGLYAVVPSGMAPDTAPVDAYLLASRMAEDAVLSYHTALELHGVAYSITERLTFVTEHRLRPVIFRSLQFRAVPLPPPLRGRDEGNLGITVIDRQGLDIRLTTRERTLVDVLDKPRYGGGWEEVWRSLEAVSFFDLDRVIDYALLLGNATTIAKVGFFLEQHREALFVEETHLEPLRQQAPKRPHYLGRTTRTSGVLLSGWNLVVPPAILERNWEEVR